MHNIGHIGLIGAMKRGIFHTQIKSYLYLECWDTIYTAEAKERMLAGKKIDPRGDSTLGSGKARKFMAIEAPPGGKSLPHCPRVDIMAHEFSKGGE